MGRNPFRTRPGGLSGPQPTHSSLGKAPASKWGTKRAKAGQRIRRDGVFPDSDAEGANRLASDQHSDSESEQDPLAAKSSTKRRSAKSTAAKSVHAYAAETRSTALSHSPRRRSIHAHSDSQDGEEDTNAALGEGDVSDHDSDTTIGADSDDPDRPAFSRKKRLRAQKSTITQTRSARTAPEAPAAEDDEQEQMTRIRAEAAARRLGVAGEGSGIVKMNKKPITLVIDDSSSDEDREPPIASTSKARLDSPPATSNPVLSPVELRRTDQPRFMTLTALRTASKKKGSKAGARKKPQKGEAFYGSGNLLVSEDEIKADEVERDLEEYLERKKNRAGNGSTAKKGKGRAGDDALFRDDSSADQSADDNDDDETASVARQLAAKKRAAQLKRKTPSGSRRAQGKSSRLAIRDDGSGSDDGDHGPEKSDYSHLNVPKFVDPRADLARRKRLAELSSPPTSDISPDDGGIGETSLGLNSKVLEKERLELKRMKKVEREMKRKKRRFREERRPGYSNPRRN